MSYVQYKFWCIADDVKESHNDEHPGKAVVDNECFNGTHSDLFD